MPAENSDERLMLRAIELSRKCIPSDQRFSVGAVLAGPNGDILAEGYSAELDSHVHAEETALLKLAESGIPLPGGSVMYSSLEPCSVRHSGGIPCCSRLIEAGISRVVFAAHEPDIFVKCEGRAILLDNGIAVTVMSQFKDLVAEVNKHLLPPGQTAQP